MENDKAKKLGIISLILFLGGSIIFRILAVLFGNLWFFIVTIGRFLPQVIGIVLVIIGMIKYPSSKFLKGVVLVMLFFSFIFIIFSNVIVIR